MPEILIIDYGVGNITSVCTALDALRVRYKISSLPEDIAGAKAFILPGVGAFAEAMHNLESRGIIEPLRREVVDNKKPLLGICLGMQILAEDSIEGGVHKGLGWVPGHVTLIPSHAGYRIPHVGWNGLTIQKNEPLLGTIPDNSQFYFDHSYYFVTKPDYVVATCDYGEPITAAVQNGNIFGVQFHPEKSQNNGLRILRAFINYVK